MNGPHEDCGCPFTNRNELEVGLAIDETKLAGGFVRTHQLLNCGDRREAGLDCRLIFSFDLDEGS